MGRVLLDTQAFVYAIDPEQLPKLPARAKRAIERADERLLSVLSISDIAFKHLKRKLSIDRNKVLGLQTLDVNLLHVTPDHVYRAFEMQLHHSDPFDRMIIAAAIEEDIPLIGGDDQFRKYKGLRIIWR